MAAALTIPITEFAPAERVPVEIIHKQAVAFDTLPLLPHLLNSVLNFVLILNQQRQIVFASQNILQLISGKNYQDLLGLRPGEALGCVHADEHDEGCGTTRFCAECGAVKAILASLAGYHDLQECRLTRIINGSIQAMDLLVFASPFVHNGEPYAIFSVADISHQKRRHALERIFFHDLINSAAGLEGLMDQLKDTAPSEMRPDLALAQEALHDLLEQVQAQRDLAGAENNELSVAPVPLNASHVLKQLTDLYANHVVAKDRRLVLDLASAPLVFSSDSTLLKRVLGNLIKNALEACPPGQEVTLGCAAAGDQIRFWIHNPGSIPPNVQLQIFNRSFSTKGRGRGLGTYSVKLLTERYLKGTVGFQSSPAEGTTFCVTLPRALG